MKHYLKIKTKISFIPKTNFPMILKQFSLYFFLLFTFSAFSIQAQNNDWCIQDAEIYTTTGETDITSCQGTGANLVTFRTTGAAQSFAFAVVDSDNIILSVGLTSTIDLASFGAGNLRVYAFSYQGQLNAQVGDDLFNTELAGFCYGITTNFIPVLNVAPDGGHVSLDNGDTERTVCVGDAVADVLQFATTSETTLPFYTYVITDNNDNILGFSEDGMIDFNNSPVGECHLWGAAFVGDILLEAGDHLPGAAFASDCYELSDNYVTIHRENPSGGEVSFEDGSDLVNACMGGNQNMGISLMNTGNANLNYAYLLTDESGIIIQKLPAAYVTFSTLPIGVSHIYGVSYSGDLTFIAGENIATTSFSEQCFELSSNYVSVERLELDAGEVFLEDGTALTTVCADNPGDLDLSFTDTATGGNDFAYVITNDDDLILDFSFTDGYDFFGFPNGTYHVYGVTYTGLLYQNTGVDFEGEVFSNGCFGVTNEAITIEIISVNGGTPFAAIGGELLDSYLYCSTESSVISIVNNDFIGTDVGIIILDETGEIIQIFAGDSFLPSTNEDHVYTIYSVAYTGTLNEDISAGMTIENGVFSDECFAVSDAFVTLEIAYVEGGELALDTGTSEAFICANDAISGTHSFGTSSNASGDYAYLLTDEEGAIYSAIDGTVANFSLLEIGTYHLYGVSYTGTLVIEFGENVLTTAISDGCYDLSDNFLTLDVTEVLGGQIATEENVEEYFICPDTGSDGSLVMSHANDEGTAYQYIVTDAAGVISQVVPSDTVFFADWEEGSFFVRGVSMTGVFTAGVGDNIFIDDLSDGCYDLSENSIIVNYSTPLVGNITTLDGESELSFCVGDGGSDLVSFLLDEVSASKLAFLITEEDGTLVGAILDSEFDFEQAIGGSNRIYALAYTGNLAVLPGDNIFDADLSLSSDCWDLSETFILINKTKVDGGIIFTSFGTDSLYVCAGDGENDVIAFGNGSFAPDADYTYVLTDVNNKVISVMENDSLDFEATGFSTLRVWGVSYTGTLDIGFGDDLENSVLSDGCYDLSTNVITIFQDMPSGGEIDYLGDTEILVCVGHEDGQVAFSTSSTSISGYVYLLMDLDGLIISVSEGPVDMTIVEPGMYRVWGLSYTGDLLAAPGLLATQVELASSCFEMSENFVLVEKGEDVDGGVLSEEITGETVIYTCPGDGIADLVVVNTTSSDPTSHFVITDDMGIVTHPQVFGNVIDFDAAPQTIARIYGVSLNGTSLIEAGVNLLEDELSTACYTISENYIKVIPITPDAGMITSDLGVNVTISTSDILSDEVSFSLVDATPHPINYVVVNDGGEIVAIQENNVYDFALFSVGTYQVYAVAFVGDMMVEVGEAFDGAVFSDACFSVTPNFITVNVAEGAVEEDISFRNSEEEVIQPAMEVKSFPNPTSDYVVVSIEQPKAAAGVISIFNVLGAKVHEQFIDTAEDVVVDMQRFTSGLYYLSVNVEGDVQTIRVIKR